MTETRKFSFSATDLAEIVERSFLLKIINFISRDFIKGLSNGTLKDVLKRSWFDYFDVSRLNMKIFVFGDEYHSFLLEMIPLEILVNIQMRINIHNRKYAAHKSLLNK